MEETIIIIETADLITKGFLPALAALSPTAVSGIAAAIPGIAKGIGSLFGGGKRRREERRAKKERGRAMRQFESMQFTNPYADMTNPYKDMEDRFEDLRVGTQAAEFTAQEQQQQLANVLDSFRGAGGGTGGAAVATALARQSSRNAQMAAANIEQQELQNQRMAAEYGQQRDLAMASADQQRQMYTAQGEADRQELEMGKRTQILGLANQRLAGAKAARAQAKSDLIGGIGSAAGAAVATFGPTPTNPKPNQIVGTNMLDRMGMAFNVGLGQGSKWKRFLGGRNVTDKTKQQIGRDILGAFRGF
jgi:hypothetical protein